MKLKEFLDVSYYNCHIELHSAYDGRLVASTRNSLEKYGEVTVKTVKPLIKVNKEGTFATPYIYVFGSAYEINEVKKNG